MFLTVVCCSIFACMRFCSTSGSRCVRACTLPPVQLSPTRDQQYATTFSTCIRFSIRIESYSCAESARRIRSLLQMKKMSGMTEPPITSLKSHRIHLQRCRLYRSSRTANSVLLILDASSATAPCDSLLDSLHGRRAAPRPRRQIRGGGRK